MWNNERFSMNKWIISHSQRVTICRSPNTEINHVKVGLSCAKTLNKFSMRGDKNINRLDKWYACYFKSEQYFCFKLYLVCMFCWSLETFTRCHQKKNIDEKYKICNANYRFGKQTKLLDCMLHLAFIWFPFLAQLHELIYMHMI